jgi:hypothetical protein
MRESVRVAEMMHEDKKETGSSRVKKAYSSQTSGSLSDRVVFLQRTIGNQGVERLIKSGALQAKLKVGQPGDEYEKEADRVAEQVMRMPGLQKVSGNNLHIQRAYPECGENELKRQPIKEEEKIQRKTKEEKVQTKAASGFTPEIDPGIENHIQSIRGRGNPLSENERAFFEPRFGYDFGSVRVHTYAEANRMAKAINAQAFTIGHDIAFAPGQYSPETEDGKRLLAHEFTHVVQQNTRMPILQLQVFRDCTPTMVGQASQNQAAIDNMVELAMQDAHTWAGNAVTALTAIQAGNASVQQQADLQAHFGILTAAQIGTLLTRFRTMHNRLSNRTLIICNSAGSFYCRPPRSWCAYTVCPTTGGYTHLCRPFFVSPPGCTEPDRISIMLHEAARSVGACQPDVEPGPGYPPANAISNVYSYSGYSRAVAGRAAAAAPKPSLKPPERERPRSPSLIEGIIKQQERRTRERVLESVEGLLSGPILQKQANLGTEHGRDTAVSTSPPSNITGRAATPAAPFYISFQNASPPASPNHSLSSPGTGREMVNRAGFTSVRLTKQMTIMWEDGPVREDGKLPFFTRSVNIYFGLDPIEVFVSADYTEGSCPYNATLQHEESHVRAFLRIFHSYRQILIQRLSSIVVPIESAPHWLIPAEIGSFQTSIQNSIAEVIKNTASELKAEMEADRNTKDSPSSYSVVYAKCPVSQWNP